MHVRVHVRVHARAHTHCSGRFSLIELQTLSLMASPSISLNNHLFADDLQNYVSNLDLSQKLQTHA